MYGPRVCLGGRIVRPVRVRAAAVTITAQVADLSPAVAVMVVLPALRAVTTPAAFTEATVGLLEVQVQLLS